MQIALITGSGRKGGLGYEVARQLGNLGYHVILAGRRQEIPDLADELKAEGISASYVFLDITDEQSARNAAAEVEAQFGKIDVLVNNAALMQAGDSVEKQDIEQLKAVFNTNVMGTWNVTQKMLPLVKKSDHGRIVNVSSGAGSYEDPKYGLLNGTEGIPASGYGISKLALNGLTIKLAKELAPHHVLVNAVCPDITDTFGTGGMWGRPVEVSAQSVVFAATLPADGPTGKFFRDGEIISW